MRIKSERGRRNGATRSDPVLSIVGGGRYVHHYASPRLSETSKKSPRGFDVEWEIDDETRRVLAIYMTPRSEGGTGFVLKEYPNQRPFFAFPVPEDIRAGLPDMKRLVVEEIITDTEVTIKFPTTSVCNSANRSGVNLG